MIFQLVRCLGFLLESNSINYYPFYSLMGADYLTYSFLEIGDISESMKFQNILRINNKFYTKKV